MEIFKVPNLGPTELIIVLIIVLVLFGAGRVSRVGGELGSAIREFRKGLQDETESEKSNEDHSQPVN
jgi:sec-independent protein translocase protein TatA